MSEILEEIEEKGDDCDESWSEEQYTICIAFLNVYAFKQFCKQIWSKNSQNIEYHTINFRFNVIKRRDAPVPSTGTGAGTHDTGTGPVSSWYRCRYRYLLLGCFLSFSVRKIIFHRFLSELCLTKKKFFFETRF